MEWFLRGWRSLTFPAESAAEAFDRIWRAGIAFRKQKRNRDGSITVRMTERDAEFFCGIAGEIGYGITPVRGLPVAAAFLKLRPGILVGLILTLVWLWYSSHLIWNVQISGNSKTSSEDIIMQLAELGCGVGDCYTKIDFNDVHARFLAQQNDIAWLSVYMNGTVAEVQVRELWPDERNLPQNGVYADIVAERAGVVEEVHVVNGSAAVKAGDVVVPGQVLISGVTELKDGELLYEYAEGEVICRTFSVIRSEAVTERDIKRYTGREKTEFSVKIFKKTLNLFTKGGIEAATCDKINMMEQVCPFGTLPLPVWIFRTVFREYELVRETIPADDAAAEAMLEMSGKIKDETEDAELVSKEVKTSFEDGVYRISCLLYLRRDNGRTEEFRLY